MSDPLELLWTSVETDNPTFTAEDLRRWPAGTADRLIGLGLLRLTTSATHVTCPACDEGHVEEVLPRKGDDGKVRFFIRCPEALRVEVPDDLLLQWTVDFDALADGLAKALTLKGHPKANPEYQFHRGESEIFTLVATDVLAEGLNLQDGDKVINYDLHWNPVRLVQRFGRIDRIGSEHDVVYAFNFLPEVGIERNLGLREKLRNRIQEIHDTIGEDAAILDPSEQLNEEAMYAIYEQHGGQLSLFEDDEEEDFVDLNEAEEMLRLLRREEPNEYERVASLRDGIRTALPSRHKGMYVFCQASYPNREDLKGYQQLFLLDENAEVVSRDIPRVLGAIKCSPDLPGKPLPAGYNRAVMRVKRIFSEEVKHRQAERQHTLSLSQGQRYVLREIRVLFGATDDEDEKARINLLERAFRGPVTRAVSRESNRLRRNGVTGQDLLKTLGELYLQHNMRAWLDRRSLQIEDKPVPKVVCSEALI